VLTTNLFIQQSYLDFNYANSPPLSNNKDYWIEMIVNLAKFITNVHSDRESIRHGDVFCPNAQESIFDDDAHQYRLLMLMPVLAWQ
jgi:hypothetical protein